MLILCVLQDVLCRCLRCLLKRLLLKEGKFNNKTYCKVYPSDAIPPQLYGAVKAH